MESTPVITIDGPAGAGKSTVARLLARRLGFIYIDSGALYRAATWLFQQQGITTEEQLTDDGQEKVLPLLLDRQKFILRGDPEGVTRLYFEQKDITAVIRSNSVESFVPFVARQRKVRETITELQRRIAVGRGAVVEGRDAGTVVFPKADVKFFLTASIKARAQRRFLEVRRSNASKPLADCIRDIEARDSVDKNREIAPLQVADDAVKLDTSLHTVNETLDSLLSRISQRVSITARSPLLLRQRSVPLIAVSGLIGVGKSTLCDWLSQKLRLPLFSENPDENPYISLYYSDRDRWALHSQMWFLYRKYELLSAIDDQKTPSIIDRTLHEDYMFARILLLHDDLEMYEHWYKLVFSLAPKPSVIVSLEASVEALLARISSRGREYERRIAPHLLEALSQEYRAWISEYTDAPVIRVDTEVRDTGDETFRSWLVKEINEALKLEGASA